jgi:hypothetical protein
LENRLNDANNAAEPSAATVDEMQSAVPQVVHYMTTGDDLLG